MRLTPYLAGKGHVQWEDDGYRSSASVGSVGPLSPRVGQSKHIIPNVWAVSF